MKRLVIMFFMTLLATSPAHADVLANQVAAEAKRLLAQIVSLEAAAKTRPGARPQPLAPTLSSDLQRFGLAASRLSVDIDRRGGPADLRCIFRGMSDETGKQLASASTAMTNADQAKALARLSHMLKDAIEIAPAVGGGGKATAASSVRAAAAQCPAVDF